MMNNIILWIKNFMNRNDLKIALDEDDFRCLVSGGILTIKNPKNEKIHIILKDIGFDRMDKAISDVDNGNLKTYFNLTRNNY